MVKALYSHPSNPMQISYSEEGISSEFILMTIGESRATSATPAPNPVRVGSKRPASRQPLETSAGQTRGTSQMPPPPTSAAPSLSRDATRARASRASPPPPQPTNQSDSIFVPNDDDRRWEPAPFDDDEEEEMLLQWDDNMDKSVG
jgi:cell cycle checkpoint control protein RAD9A